MPVLSSEQTQLFAFLSHSVPTLGAKALLKRTFQQFVMEYGWWFEPGKLPNTIHRSTIGECHKNATHLMLTDDSLIYCEGFALFKPEGQPILHAWVTDGNGNAIDNTWPQPGVAYAGVPFRNSFVSMTCLKNRATISLLDDYQNSYPLRGELGDRPDEWLELKGQGVAKVQTQI